MAKRDAWRAIREIVAERDGWSCHYCGVPTAATIEHLQPRSHDGVHDLSNLVLACPLCNLKRGNRSLDEWYKTKGWKVSIPASDKLGGSIDEMLENFWNVKRKSTLIDTGSTNTRIRLEDNIVRVEVRSGKGYDWNVRVLGSQNNPRVLAAVYDILQRHVTARKKLPK